MPTIRSRTATLTLLALAGLSATASAQPDFVNGGIGTAEVKQIEAQMPAYNLRLVFSEGMKNDYVSNVALRILDGHGHAVLTLDDAGPLTNVRLPAGHYVVDAKFGQIERRNPIELKAGAPVDLYLHFPGDDKSS